MCDSLLHNLISYMYFTLYTLYSVHCTPRSVHCTFYNVQCTVYTEHYTVYTVHYTLYTVPVYISPPHQVWWSTAGPAISHGTPREYRQAPARNGISASLETQAGHTDDKEGDRGYSRGKGSSVVFDFMSAYFLRLLEKRFDVPTELNHCFIIIWNFLNTDVIF